MTLWTGFFHGAIAMSFILILVSQAMEWPKFLTVAMAAVGLFATVLLGVLVL